jgi:hypothetical protein
MHEHHVLLLKFPMLMLLSLVNLSFPPALTNFLTPSLSTCSSQITFSNRWYWKQPPVQALCEGTYPTDPYLVLISSCPSSNTARRSSRTGHWFSPGYTLADDLCVSSQALVLYAPSKTSHLRFNSDLHLEASVSSAGSE